MRSLDLNPTNYYYSILFLPLSLLPFMGLVIADPAAFQDMFIWWNQRCIDIFPLHWVDHQPPLWVYSDLYQRNRSSKVQQIQATCIRMLDLVVGIRIWYRLPPLILPPSVDQSVICSALPCPKSPRPISFTLSPYTTPCPSKYKCTVRL